MKNAVRIPTDTEDKLKKVESKKIQRLTSNKMFLHSLDDSRKQFEMAIMMDICKPTVGAVARLMRAMRYCSVKPTLFTL